MLEELAGKEIKLFLRYKRVRAVLEQPPAPDVDLVGIQSVLDDHDVMQKDLRRTSIESLESERQAVLKEISDRQGK